MTCKECEIEESMVYIDNLEMDIKIRSDTIRLKKIIRC